MARDPRESSGTGIDRSPAETDPSSGAAISEADTMNVTMDPVTAAVEMVDRMIAWGRAGRHDTDQAARERAVERTIAPLRRRDPALAKKAERAVKRLAHPSTRPEDVGSRVLAVIARAYLAERDRREQQLRDELSKLERDDAYGPVSALARAMGGLGGKEDG